MNRRRARESAAPSRQKRKACKTMKWKKYTVNTLTGVVDIISAEFADLGIEGIEIEDHVPLSDSDTKGMFIDILPELPPDDGSARVSFYLDEDADCAGMLEKVRACLQEISGYADIGPGTIEEGETEDKDWINNWKQYFHPFAVDDIVIKPTWEPLPDWAEGKTLIQIDPGTAFGTGSHETTQLCIRQLEKYLKVFPGAKVLDVGTGSGILGIAALKLGASSVFATDLDDNAIEAVGENLAVNGIPEEQFQVVCGNLIDDPAVQEQAGDACYDIAVANILAPVIILLQGEVARHIRRGGIFITSGIIDDKEQAVREAFEKNPAFEFVEATYQGEWVSLTYRRV